MRKGEVTDIGCVEDLVQYQRVTVEGKAVDLEQMEEVSGGKMKQDLVVADSSGSIRLTIWEEVIGSMEEGKSYRFAGEVVHGFRERNSFQCPRLNLKLRMLLTLVRLKYLKRRKFKMRKAAAAEGWQM